MSNGIVLEGMETTIILDGTVPPESLDMSGIDSVDIRSGNNDLFQNEHIEKYIEKMKSKEEIKLLRISYGVVLRNLEIIKHFPNLEKFLVDSGAVQSFQGLEHLKSAKYIEIDTEKNKKRSLEGLSCTSTLKQIGVEFGNMGDYEAISRCTSLVGLCIGRGPAPDFRSWNKLPIENLKFWNYCKFTELEDMAYLSKLSSVMIGACQKFRCFKGDNSSMKTLRIDGSKYFDIASLKTCTSLGRLNITGSIPLICLDDFPVLENVKIIELVDIKVDVGNLELETKMPNLKTLYFNRGGTKDEVINLSKKNKEILVCKSGKGYINGVQEYNKYEWLQKHGWFSFPEGG